MRQRELPPTLGFPAHAGMDPTQKTTATNVHGFPRTRGDGPVASPQVMVRSSVSPHTRGWTRRDGGRGPERRGFPAHAGMDPGIGGSPTGGTGFPRTRGDGPSRHSAGAPACEVSPHTRGWTLPVDRWRVVEYGFPAHAGMDPDMPAPPSANARFPRTRGDGPRREESEPHAQPGSAGFPRTRGDGPSVGLVVRHTMRVSPHTRGWTQARCRHVLRRHGFPAHAGMDPKMVCFVATYIGFPRTRGDGPEHGEFKTAESAVSPHTRGWTPQLDHAYTDARGFPAHAGMDPYLGSASLNASRFPRTRGDGPCRDARGHAWFRVSPHTRGWTPPRHGRVDADGGFPAHAGMDPDKGLRAVNYARFPRTRGDGPHAS